MTTTGWQQRWGRAVQNTYGTPPVVLVRGAGAQVWDDTGAVYLDMLAGIAVNVLGHAHPAVVAAVQQQVATLSHTSNLALTRPAVELAETLVQLAGAPGRVFFCNSGTEATEAAIKLTRLTGRTRLVAADGSFHGRTAGALSITGQPAKREPFAPLLPDVDFVPYGEAAALRNAVDQQTAAVFLEPVQGEAGVVPAPGGYLPAAAEACRAAGALLVLDEVQTGIGRTGSWFAFQASGTTPDVLTLAKGLGGGVPIGAMIAFGPAAELLQPGQHGSTFGGNPLACSAALAVLRTVGDDGLLERAEQIGRALTAGVAGLAHPLVDHVRGRGALLGVVLTQPVAAAVEAQLRDRGVLVNAAQPDVLRLAPPLVLTDAQVDQFLIALAGALAAVPARDPAPAREHP